MHAKSLKFSFLRPRLFFRLGWLLACTFVLQVQAQLSITTTSLPDGMEMVPYEVQLEAAGGLEPYRWFRPGSVVSWGSNISQAAPPDGLENVVSIAAGEEHSLALKSDGTVVGWGGGNYGQAIPPEGLEDVVSIAVGGVHSLALKSDGTVVGWGWDGFGQATPPVGLMDVVSIAAGSHHSLALKSDGTVVGWGADWDGQATPPAGLEDVVSIAAGGEHCLALKSDGAVVCWGLDSSGQATPPVGLEDVVSITAGNNYSLALKTDGTVVAWGDDYDGQATPPVGLEDVVSISAGYNHSLALKSDGSMVGWGDNYYNEATPPVGLEDVVSITAGHFRSFALVQSSSAVFEGMILESDGRITGVPTLAGNMDVTVVVHDHYGSLTFKSLNLDISSNPNTRPVITASSVAAGSVRVPENQNQVFGITANDPEGQPLTYIWKLNGEGVGSNQSSFDFSTIWGQAGSYTLEVEVQDDLWNIGTITRSWDITVPSDNDGDGIGNLAELDLGRDPNNPNDGGGDSNLSGVIYGEGTPLEGARVELRGASGKVYAQTISAVDGSYVVNGVIPGTYQRKVIAEGFGDQWYNGVYQQDQATDYVVSADTDLVNQDVTLLEGQSPAYVTVESDPAGAEVYLNYFPTGEVTPVTLDLGEIEGENVASHVITLVKSGSPRPSPQSVPALEAETVELMFDLVDPASGSLSIDSSPQGAVVYVDRVNVSEGVTPVTIGNLAPGSHVVFLKKEGYLQPRPVIAWVEADTVTPMTVPLTLDSEPGMVVVATSEPDGAEIYLDYLPTGQVTDIIIASLDSASHSGSGWHSASHTWMLSTAGVPSTPRYVDGFVAQDMVESVSPGSEISEVYASDSLTFSVSLVGGASASFVWELDGSVVGGNGPSFTYTPSNGEVGSHVLQAKLASGPWAGEVLQEWSFDVLEEVFRITTTSLPDGMEMVPYDVQLEAAGGMEPYRWFSPDTVLGWGYDDYGQATPPVGLEDVVSITAGSYHSLALKSDGTVVGWGYDNDGQATSPVGLEDVVSITAGNYHSLALKSDGTVVGWGEDSYGQATPPDGLEDVVSIAAGNNYSLALKSDGTVVGWGYDVYGQATPPVGLEDVVSITAGYYHSLALKSDGTVVGWGRDYYGQATPPVGLEDMVSITAGGYHSLALKSDGSLVGWGRDHYGQATPPDGLEDVVSISGGYYHSLALKSDGTVVGWGRDYYGQATPPVGLEDVVSIDAGGYHTLALVKVEGMSLESDGRIIGAPTLAGNMDMNVVVQDRFGNMVFKSLNLDISSNPNTRPLISNVTPSQSDLSMFASASQTFSITASDPEGQPLSYAWTLNGSPVGYDSPSLTLGDGDWELGQNVVRVSVADDLWTDQVYQEWTVDTSSSFATISGTVTEPDGVTPLVNIQVRIFEQNQWGWWDENWDLSVYTDSNGSYSFQDLTPGTYRIGFRDWEGDYALDFYGNALFVDSAASISAGEGVDVTGIDASLSFAARISGIVTASDGTTPLESIYVGVASQHPIWGYSVVSYTNTNTNGEYSVGGLLAGTYRVVFRDWQNNDYLSEVYENASDWDLGIDVVVGEGSTISGINASLEEGGIIAGILLDSAGNPVVGMSVRVRYWNSTYESWWWANSTTTDSSGAYEVNQLRTGSYRVMFEDYNGTYVNQVYGNPVSSTDPGTGQAVSVTAGTTTTLPNELIRRLGTVSGTVLSADGSLLVSGVKVYLIDGTLSSHAYKYGGQRGEAITDANGNFTIPRVLEGSYHAIATTASIPENLLPEWQDGTLHYAVPGGEPVPAGATAIVVAEGENVQGIDFDLDTGSIVSGKVTTEEDVPLEDVVLTYLLEASGYHFSITTDENGDYNQSKIPPGSYLRKVAAVGFQDLWYDGANHKDQAIGYAIPAATALLGEDVQLAVGQSPAYVTVQSDPAGAEVFFNYTPTGEVTPITLDLGEIEGDYVASHVITLVRNGSPRPVPQTVPAIEAETIEVFFDLVDPASGSLSIDSSPQGATVYVDRADTQAGTTPVTVTNLAPGSHVVLLKRAGSLQPRPIIAWVEDNATTDVNLPLTPDSSAGLQVTASSAPSGMDVYVNYLPTAEVTDVVISTLDAASHSGSGWHSASHTIMLSHPEWGSGAARYVDAEHPATHQNVSFEDATDTNSNGLPDQWEDAYDFAYQAPVDKQGAEDDADGDGVSNEDELAAGTNPLSAASKVKVSSLDVEKVGVDDKLTLTFQTVPGRRYVVQATDNLLSGWLNVSGVVQAQSSSTTFVIMLPVNTEAKYYRLLILKQ